MAARLMPGLERRLKAEQVGDVRFDVFTRGRYSTDASHYQIMPLGVVAPRTIEQAERAIAICRAEGVSVLPRGGGTSQAGQTVNESLVIDCSRHLNRIIDLDVAGRRCVVEPGIVLDELNRALEAARGCGSRSTSRPPRAPPSAAWRATIPAARARCATAIRARTCCRSTPCSPTARARISVRRSAATVDVPHALARDLLALGGARGGRDRAALPQGAAPRRRLQSRCAAAGPERRQSRAYAGRLGRHAGVLHARSN